MPTFRLALTHHPVIASALAATWLGLWPPASLADNCDSIRAGIDERIRARGVSNFVLTIVEAGTAKVGRVLGSCGNGTRQIVQTLTDKPTPPPAPAAAAATPAAAPRVAPAAAMAPPPRDDPADKIPTECKDGSIVIGPNCDNPRAVRMTKAQLEAAAPAPAASAASAPQ